MVKKVFALAVIFSLFVGADTSAQSLQQSQNLQNTQTSNQQTNSSIQNSGSPFDAGQSEILSQSRSDIKVSTQNPPSTQAKNQNQQTQELSMLVLSLIVLGSIAIVLSGFWLFVARKQTSSNPQISEKSNDPEEIKLHSEDTEAQATKEATKKPNNKNRPKKKKKKAHR